MIYYDNNNITVVVETNFQLLIVLLLYRISQSVLETNHKIKPRIKRQQCLIKKILKKQTKSSPIILRHNRLNVVTTAIAPLPCITTTTTTLILLPTTTTVLQYYYYYYYNNNSTTTCCETSCVGIYGRSSYQKFLYIYKKKKTVIETRRWPSYTLYESG